MKTYFRVKALLVSLALCGAVQFMVATQEREASAGKSRSIKSDVLVAQSYWYKLNAKTENLFNRLVVHLNNDL